MVYEFCNNFTQMLEMTRLRLKKMH